MGQHPDTRQRPGERIACDCDCSRRTHDSISRERIGIYSKIIPRLFTDTISATPKPSSAAQFECTHAATMEAHSTRIADVRKKSEIEVPEFNLYQRSGSPYWYVKFTINGEAVPKSTKQASKTAATEFAINFYREEYAKRIGGTDGKVITLERACGAFLDAMADGGRTKDTVTMHRSICRRMMGFKTMKGGAIIPVPGLIEPDAYLHSITRESFDAFLVTMKAHYGPSTYRIHVGRLKVFFDWCNERQQNYAITDVEFPNGKTRVGGKKHFEPMKVRTRTFSDDQVDELLAILTKSRNPSNVLMVLILADVPIRHNEACSLHWSQLDLSAGTVVVDRSKGSEDGTIVLTDRLAEQFALHAHGHGKQGYVFKSNTDTGHRSVKNDKWFRKAMSKMEDDPNSEELVRINNGETLSIHSFRHTYGKNLAREMPREELQDLYGHKSPKMTALYAKMYGNASTVKATAIINARLAARRTNQQKPAE